MQAHKKALSESGYCIFVKRPERDEPMRAHEGDILQVVLTMARWVQRKPTDHVYILTHEDALEDVVVAIRSAGRGEAERGSTLRLAAYLMTRFKEQARHAEIRNDEYRAYVRELELSIKMEGHKTLAEVVAAQ